MKRFLLLILAAVMVLSCFSCGAKEDPSKKSEGVMTYAEYDAAELDTDVVIEAYVQAKQSWWDNKATIYTQDGDGAYFIYEMPCTEDEYNKMTIGTKIRVAGVKSAWAGEIEIMNVTSVEILEGTYVAEAKDVTALLGTDDLIKSQNQFVSFKGMTVVASDNGEAVSYKGGEPGDDIYFKVSIDGKTYDFTIERYLTDPDTEVYKAVQNLKVGDVIDMEGFLYWYNGVNPHITSVKAAG